MSEPSVENVKASNKQLAADLEQHAKRLNAKPKRPDKPPFTYAAANAH